MIKNLVDNIHKYFVKKDKGEPIGKSPEGTCSVCWGQNEWDGEYYKIIKDKHALPGGQVYVNFISKIVNEHVRTTHNLKDKYVCVTCNKEIK